MSVFRNIMAVLGGIAVVLALVFGFGMLNQYFRNFVNDILNTVPAQEYQQTNEENKNLLQNVQDLTDRLNNLTTERDDLASKIEDLETNAEADATTIEQYKQDLTALNEEIDRLEDKIATTSNQFDNITQNINNATLQYMDIFARVHYSHFDSTGNPMWTEFSSGTELGNHYHIGSEMEEFLTQYENVIDSVSKTLEYDLGTAAIEIAEYYKLQLNGYGYMIDLPATENYFEIANDGTVGMKYILSGVEVTREDLISQVEGLTGYLLSANYDYTIDSETGLVNNLICEITIELA